MTRGNRTPARTLHQIGAIHPTALSTMPSQSSSSEAVGAGGAGGTARIRALWRCSFCSVAPAPGAGGEGSSPAAPAPAPSARTYATKAAFLAHFGRACHICGHEFSCPSSLSAHRASHASREARHVCNVCEARFHSREEFNEHKRTHRPYGCVGCPRVSVAQC